MSKDNSNFFKKKNEWSVIKDKLLGCYLTPYFQKVLRTGKPICYVDCFAGKGMFDDGTEGSPLIALKTRESCLQLTKIRDKHGAIKTRFIELNHATDLSKNVKAVHPSYDEPIIIPGAYEDNIEKILSRERGSNVFLYIDPYGIKALDAALFRKFKTMGFNSFEMLINFNSFGFFRDACRVLNVDYHADEALQGLDDLVEYEPTLVSADKESEDLLTAVAGGDYWKAIVLDYKTGKLDGYQAEQRLSTEYKQNLKKDYGYVLDMPIRLKAGQRPKYRMIHVCDHEDGCFLMAQNMQKRKDELFISIQQENQLSIFDVAPDYSSTVEGELLSRNQIAEMVSECMDAFPGEVSITKFVATFVNQYGLVCEFRMIYDILTEMQTKKKIEIRRNPSHRFNHQPSTFWEENKDHSVIIRRIRQ